MSIIAIVVLMVGILAALYTVVSIMTFLVLVANGRGASVSFIPPLIAIVCALVFLNQIGKL